MDNGTEMTRNIVADWCRLRAADISFKDLGSPWQNAFSEHAVAPEKALGLALSRPLAEPAAGARSLEVGASAAAASLPIGLSLVGPIFDGAAFV